MLERDGPGNLTSLFEGRRTLRGGEVRSEVEEELKGMIIQNLDSKC